MRLLALADARRNKIERSSARGRIETLKDQIQFIADTWLDVPGCAAGKQPQAYAVKMQSVLDRMANLFERCARFTDGDDPPFYDGLKT